MKSRSTHARFRVIEGGRSPRTLLEPRKYAQSTSGRKSSHRTTPADSRSISMAKDSRMDCFTEIALRKYPTEVLQRPANALCADGSSELRYKRSVFTGGVLLGSNDLSIPDAPGPAAAGSYPSGVDISTVRKNRLRELLASEFGGSQTELANHMDVEQNYISKLLGKGAFGEKAARRIERDCSKPIGWLDSSERTAPASPSSKHQVQWPFSAVSLSEFESLDAKHRREIDDALAKLVFGAQAQQMFSQRRRRA